MTHSQNRKILSIPKRRISCTIEEVTPKMAERWLSNNPENRPIEENRVCKYAEKMIRGEWKEKPLDGTPLIVMQEGELINGQHRLMAVLKCGKSIRNLVVKPRKEKLTVKAGAFKNNHLTALNLPSGVNYVFDNGRESLTFKADIGEPVFSGNDFEKLVIEPNWYGRDLANYSGCIDYNDTRGKLKEVVYKSGCKSLSYLKSKTLQTVSIPKSICVDEKGKKLKNFSNAWFCAPKLKVADINYEKGGIWGMTVWQKPTSAQKLQFELDGISCGEISEEIKNAPEGERVGAYTDSR